MTVSQEQRPYMFHQRDKQSGLAELGTKEREIMDYPTPQDWELTLTELQ